jgi:hypothetical protein
MEEMNNVPQTQQQRPTLLTVLCILTFIGSGLSLLIYLLAALLFGAMVDMLQSIPGFAALASGGMVMFILLFVLAFVSLFGAIKMWSLKKVGFYMYTAAQILMIIVPLVFLEGAQIGILGIVITILFIILYGLNLKVME